METRIVSHESSHQSPLRLNVLNMNKKFGCTRGYPLVSFTLFNWYYIYPVFVVDSRLWVIAPFVFSHYFCICLESIVTCPTVSKSVALVVNILSEKLPTNFLGTSSNNLKRIFFLSPLPLSHAPITQIAYTLFLLSCGCYPCFFPTYASSVSVICLFPPIRLKIMSVPSQVHKDVAKACQQSLYL